jgi:hypothetical protein
VQAGFAVVMAVCLVLVLATPETVDLERRAAERPPRFALRPGAGALFGSAATLGFFAFALLGLVSSLGAIMLSSKLGIASHFVAGLASFLMFGASALAQLALGGLRLAVMTLIGAVAFPVGLALVAVSLYHPLLWLFLLAVFVGGAGAGMLFKSGVAKAAGSAMPASRAGVLAVYFVAGYLGMGLPAILFSVVIRHVGIGASMVGFAVVLSAGAALSVAAGRRAEARPRAGSAS